MDPHSSARLEIAENPRIKAQKGNNDFINNALSELEGGNNKKTMTSPQQKTLLTAAQEQPSASATQPLHLQYLQQQNYLAQLNQQNLFSSLSASGSASASSTTRPSGEVSAPSPFYYPGFPPSNFLPLNIPNNPYMQNMHQAHFVMNQFNIGGSMSSPNRGAAPPTALNSLNDAQHKKFQPSPSISSAVSPSAHGKGSNDDALDLLATGENVDSSGWDEAEDNVLRAAVASYGGKNWELIANHLPNRSAVQCLSHWKNVISTSVLKGKGSWTKEEDEKLKEVVKEHGAKNWSVIARHLPSRLGKQCRERWVNHLDPTLKKTPWTEREEKIAQDAHQQFGNKWSKIAKLLPGRSDNDVKNHWYASLRRRKTKLELVQVAYERSGFGEEADEMERSPKKRRTEEEVGGRWKPQEGASLLALVDEYGTDSWPLIASKLPGRTEAQCVTHWKNVLNPNVIKGRGSWSAEEDKKLRQLVAKFGPQKWSTVIAPQLPGRIGKQCRERWTNTLDPNLKRQKWSKEEEDKLAELHGIHGNKWKRISKDLEGRSDNDVKNHFYASLRRKKGKKPSLEL